MDKPIKLWKCTYDMVGYRKNIKTGVLYKGISSCLSYIWREDKPEEKNMVTHWIIAWPLGFKVTIDHIENFNSEEVCWTTDIDLKPRITSFRKEAVSDQ